MLEVGQLQAETIGRPGLPGLWILGSISIYLTPRVRMFQITCASSDARAL